MELHGKPYEKRIWLSRVAEEYEGLGHPRKMLGQPVEKSACPSGNLGVTQGSRLGRFRVSACVCNKTSKKGGWGAKAVRRSRSRMPRLSRKVAEHYEIYLAGVSRAEIAFACRQGWSVC